MHCVTTAGDTETLPEGTEAPVNMHTLRIQEAGSVTLTAEEVQRATRDIASTPAPQALPVISPLFVCFDDDVGPLMCPVSTVGEVGMCSAIFGCIPADCCMCMLSTPGRPWP